MDTKQSASVRRTRWHTTTCLLALTASAVGCSGRGVSVDFEASEVPVVAPAFARVELMRYLDPKSNHPPMRLGEAQRSYEASGPPEAKVFPNKRQVVFLWNYTMPGVMDEADKTLQVTTALQMPVANFEVLDRSAGGRGWSVRSTFERFWSGDARDGRLLDHDHSLEHGQAALREDGFEFPSAIEVFLSGGEASEFEIGNLSSRQEAMDVIALLKGALASYEAARFAGESPDPRSTRPMVIPTAVRAGEKAR